MIFGRTKNYNSNNMIISSNRLLFKNSNEYMAAFIPENMSEGVYLFEL